MKRLFPVFMPSGSNSHHHNVPDYSRQLEEKNRIEREALKYEKEKNEIERLQRLTDEQLLKLLNRTDKTITYINKDQILSGYGRMVCVKEVEETVEESNPEYERIYRECYLRGLV